MRSTQCFCFVTVGLWVLGLENYRNALYSNFFINSEEQEKLVNNLKNIFFKNNLTNKELRILHGVITNIKKN